MALMGVYATLDVVGLDLSLTSTGIALTDGSTRKVTTNAADRLEVRLAAIVKGIGEALDACEADGAAANVVAVEDFVTASRFSGAVAPVHGAVRLWLWNMPMMLAIIPAKSVKLYASGKGNCDKDAMGIAAMKRAGLDFSGKPDECDAWWLRAMTLDAYGAPVVDMPAAHRAALEKITWPSVATAKAAS
jgi:Holliday junction resolvasome RuvABC endonuclease subunit